MRPHLQFAFLAGVLLATTSSPLLAGDRTFAVTTTADSGAGSLRQVISDVNAQCTSVSVTIGCHIVFMLPPPVPSEGWYTIEPLSALPAIAANSVSVDGETQTAVTGDTNPLGPEVFLLGDRAGDANGLSLSPTPPDIRGLAIGGFARNGIAFNFNGRATGRIERNYIGVDPTGSRPVPNGLRGIDVTGFGGEIRDNVISGNGRSGMVVQVADPFTISGNRIGLAAHTDDPIPNGASGIFVTNTNPFYGAQIEANRIEFNQDFGIALSNVLGVRILENAIAHNRNLAIDYGMDGPTLTPPAGLFAAAPAILSATFDSASGQTVVSGRAEVTGIVSGYEQTVTVFLYANHADVSEGEQFIGQVRTQPDGTFALRVDGDFRGEWIAGTSDRIIDFHDYVSRNSSEFGGAQLVLSNAGRRRPVRQ